MRYLTFFGFLLGSIAMVSSGCQSLPQDRDGWTLASPDGTLLISIQNEAPEEGTGAVRLRYRVDRVGQGMETEVLGWAPLGITREDADFSQNLQYTGEEQRTFEDSYSMLRGKQAEITAEGNELRLNFTGSNGAPLDVIFRAYNDGVAFRYHFPGDGNTAHTVTGEETGFQIPEGRVWLQPYGKVTKYTPAYEQYYENGIPVGTPADSKEGWALPALFEANGHWVLLSESDLDGNYFGGHLQPESPGGLYSIRLPEPEEAMGNGSREPSATLPWTMPWRVAIIGQDLGTVVESTLITDLAKGSVLSDTSWIQPGRASWSWWSDHPSSREFDKLKSFIDLAADMGWEYSLVDANWNTMEGGTIEELIDYANEKGVGILMWYNSGGTHNTVEEQPRDRMWDPETRRAEFRQLQEWGVKGVKVDFFQSDKPLLIQQYLDILEDAAEYGILVNFHGCTIPRGWGRTYPNLMSMESVKGAEAYSFEEQYPEQAPVQNTIFAATRNVIGPMDYTPVTFSDNVYPHKTTDAHELALSVVFETGILHLADRVSAYTGLPDPIRQALEKIPVTWEETRFISGTPGKDFAIARRHDNDWYIAGINGEEAAKTFNVDLSFTGDGERNMLVVTDGPEPRRFNIEESSGSVVDSLNVETLPHGGFFIRVSEPGGEF